MTINTSLRANRLWITFNIFSLLFLATIQITPLRYIFGTLGFLLIPGFLLVELVLPKEPFVQKFGLAIIFGISLQLLIISSIYVAGSIFYIEQLNFEVVVVLINIIALSILLIMGHYNRERHFERSKILIAVNHILKSKEEVFLLSIFLLSVLLRLYFQDLISTGFGGYPGADSGLFLDVGRALNNGEFTPKNIHPPLMPCVRYFSGNKYWYIGHPMVCFAYALFFLLGGVNIGAAKLMNVAIGSLIMFPLYGVTKELLGKRVAIISVVLATIHPFLISFSSIIDGREILGTLLLLSAYYFALLTLQRKESKAFAVITGIFLFLTLYTTEYIFYVFLASISLIFLLSNMKEGIKRVATGVILLGGFFITIRKLASAFINPTPLWVWIAMLTYPLMNILVYKKTRNGHGWMLLLNLTLISTCALTALFTLVNLKMFLHPELLEPPLLQYPQQQTPFMILEYFGLSTTMFNNLVEKLIVFCKMELFFWAILPSVIPLLVLFVPSKWREKTLIFAYPLSLTFFAVLRGSQHFLPPNIPISTTLFPLFDLTFIRAIRQVSGAKIILCTTPFILIASAMAIEHAGKVLGVNAQSMKTPLKIGKVVKREPIPDVPKVTAIGLSIILVFQFAPYYNDYKIRNSVSDSPHAFQGLYERLKPVLIWIDQNTDQDTVLMHGKSRPVAWYTNRTTVHSWIHDPATGECVNFTTLQLFIKRYRVNYLIIDLNTEESLRKQFMDPLHAPKCCSLIFQYQRPDNLDVMIYDVTNIWATEGNTTTNNIENTSQFTNATVETASLSKEDNWISCMVHGLYPCNEPIVWNAKLLLYNQLGILIHSDSITFPLKGGEDFYLSFGLPSLTKGEYTAELQVINPTTGLRPSIKTLTFKLTATPDSAPILSQYWMPILSIIIAGVIALLIWAWPKEPDQELQISDQSEGY